VVLASPAYPTPKPTTAPLVAADWGLHGHAASSTLCRAIGYIHENAHTDVGLDDIAEAIHLTPRAVQYMFRRQLDTTPLTYLRWVRLQHAHRELLAANSHADTVTAIAAKWGWAHPGRFSQAYRAVFGQPPSRTLRERQA
jgi:transcriptional regulator GlxA family with amidase domain